MNKKKPDSVINASSRIKPVFIILFILCGCFSASAQYQWVKESADIDGEASGDQSGFSVSITPDGSVVAIGAMYNDGSGLDAGHVRVYRDSSGVWVQKGCDIDGEAAGDNSGRSVSLNSTGNVLAVGATMNDGNGISSGHVRIYQFMSGNWIQIGNDINGETSNDESGFSVSLNGFGTVVAISSQNNDGTISNSNVGHVRVFEYYEATWVQLGSDIDGANYNDYSGHSISLSADSLILAIGSFWGDLPGQPNSNAGFVKIYKYVSGNWQQMGNAVYGEGIGDMAGCSVSLSANGSRVAIGAMTNSTMYPNGGQARVFEYSGGSWIQIGSSLYGEADYDSFGVAVSLSPDGNYVASGAWYNNGNGNSSGNTTVFKYESNDWVQIGADIDGEFADDYSGASVALAENGSRVAIGARNNDGNGSNSGHVRLFYPCSVTYGTDVVNACYYYTWINGMTYTSSNDSDVFIIPNANGCDSVVTLNLTIGILDTSVTETASTLTSNTAGALYQWLDCDNSYSEIPGATNQSFTPSGYGNYAVKVFRSNCADTSNCHSILYNGNDEYSPSNNIAVFPNPSTENFNVEMESTCDTIAVAVYNQNGQLIKRFSEYNIQSLFISLDGPDGIYYVVFTSEKESVCKKLVKMKSADSTTF